MLEIKLYLDLKSNIKITQRSIKKDINSIAN